MEKQNNICKFCGKTKSLIRAHVIPKAFYIGGNKYVLKDLREGETKRRNSGTYDTNILCSDCDNHVLGIYDNYAAELLLREYTKHIEQQNEDFTIYHFKENEFDYNAIRAFIVSILWRASVSNLRECEDVFLGKYENIAKEIIKSENQHCGLFKMFFFKISDNNTLIKNVFYFEKVRIEDNICYRIRIKHYLVFVFVNGKIEDNIMEMMFNKKDFYIMESKQNDSFEYNKLHNLAKQFKEKKYTNKKVN